MRVKSGWGGRRTGAGRRRGPRPAVPHLRRGRVRASEPCHVTLRLRKGLPSIRTRAFVSAFERSVRALRERTDFRLVHYSLQANHVHAVVEADGTDALGRGMTALATRIALLVKRVLRVRGRVFAERYHLHHLTTPREVRNALAYVLLNARKHLAERIGRTAALRAVVAPDPASSARWFGGWRTPLPNGVAEAAPVAPARSWLGSVGWRMHGLIDRSEIPGRSPIPAVRPSARV